VKYAESLTQKFRHFSFWSQVLITLGSLVILVAIWSACGSSPPPPPPLDSASHDYPVQRKSVNALTCSPDGKRLLFGGDDRAVQLWDFPNGPNIGTWKGHRDAITAVAFRPDGEMAASASKDKTVKLWKVSSGKELLTLTGHAAAVTGIAFNPDGNMLASASEDKTAKLWEVPSGKLVRTLSGHTGGVATVVFSPDGKIVATGSSDKSVRLWDTSSGEFVRTLAGPKSRVSAMAFSPDGKVLAAGTGENVTKRVMSLSISRSAKVTVWDPQTGQEVHTSESFSASVTALAFRPDGKELAVSFVGGEGRAHIQFFSVPGFTPGRQIMAHRGPARSIAFSPGGGWLISAGLDKKVHVWKEP
jgi:WD40 repeat protein